VTVAATVRPGASDPPVDHGVNVRIDVSGVLEMGWTGTTTVVETGSVETGKVEPVTGAGVLAGALRVAVPAATDVSRLADPQLAARRVHMTAAEAAIEKRIERMLGLSRRCQEIATGRPPLGSGPPDQDLYSLGAEGRWVQVAEEEVDIRVRVSSSRRAGQRT